MTRAKFSILLCALGGCTNHPPDLQPITPQTFAVGVRGEIEIRAYDPDGDDLSYDYAMVGLDVSDRAQLKGFVDRAIFTYTPLATDVGQYQLDITVSDGYALDLETIPVTVRSGAPLEGLPRFIRPIGAGTPFYVAQSKCLEIDVLVEDTDSESVILRQDPAIPGSTLEQRENKSALFSWCPTAQQLAVTRYTLHLSADDGENPPVHYSDGRGYYILLEK
jgi:hypothetical protein